MTWKKKINPGEKVPLKLTPTETKAILEDLMCLDRQYEEIIQETPAGKPVMMSLYTLPRSFPFLPPPPAPPNK